MVKHPKLIRCSIPIAIGLALLYFIFYGEKQPLNTSDIILLITAVLIAWYSFETLSLVDLSRVKDQPFLEIEFPRRGAKVILKNLGPTPAYSASITPLIVGDNTFRFDPLWSARVSILPGEEREIWMYHKHKDGSSLSESLPPLHGLLIKKEGADHSIEIQYFDKDGIKLKRMLFIRGGGNFLSSDLKVYATTSREKVPTFQIDL